jgi:acetyl-CoA carboxylase, biotin carboxylase subunit
MIKRLLIANRGEIALRIVRTCRELGIETVAAYSKVDSNLLHLKYADEIVCISHTSYLDQKSMVISAGNHGCDAIHPGYGFLAENAEFAAMVEAEGLIFVGPDSGTISLMGNKSRARQTAESHELSLVPGSELRLTSSTEALDVAREIGFPVLLKAVYGGGGRGIRIVDDEKDYQVAFAEAESEAASAFGNGDLYIEKYLNHARHIEVQIIGDGFGAAVHLGSRECSVQRRHQKLVEEAPACNLPSGLLKELCEKSRRMAEALNYRGLGTLEFLYQDEEFYFIEMNTRIQVEHPVTECVTGLDLVKLQIEVSAGRGLNILQDDISVKGHAFECRINAEDENFNPGPGIVNNLEFPGGPGVRVDSHLYNGYDLPHQYDSLVAKLIASDVSREAALARMQRALGEFSVNGIESNVELHKQIFSHERFAHGVVDTNFLQQELLNG